MVNLVGYAFNFEFKPIIAYLQKEEMPIGRDRVTLIHMVQH